MKIRKVDTYLTHNINFGNLISFALLSLYYISCIPISPQENHAEKNPYFTDKVDVFGRNYRLKRNGEIKFAIDDSYKEALPDISQLDIHIAEANTLSVLRKYIPAIRLFKGITLCQKIGFKNKKTINPEIQKTLNRLISQNQDRKDELEILTEPYGCYAQNKKGEKRLFIESKDFSYLIETDPDFRYLFPTDKYRFARMENEYNWKVSYFRIVLPQEEKEDTFESEYIKYENQIFYESPNQIVLSIGQTFHKYTLSDKSHYPDLWDGRRGLSQSVKRASNFTRKDLGDGSSSYETSFNLTQYSEIRSYFAYETYKFNKSKGVGTILTCPKGAQEACKHIWKEMKY